MEMEHPKECMEGLGSTPSSYVTLEVDGMFCQRNCGSTVQNALGMVPGVTKAEVSFKEKRARVWGLGVSLTALVDAVECVGFGAFIVPDVVLDVEGMMCQKNCGSTVQAALSAVPGVTKAEVNFAEKRASVWCTGVAVKVLIDAVECVGFEATAPPDVILTVQGMMCEKSCGSTVQNSLSVVPGVSKVKLSFEDGIALVWGGPAALQEADLIEAVKAVGFGAIAAPPRGNKISRQWNGPNGVVADRLLEKSEPPEFHQETRSGRVVAGAGMGKHNDASKSFYAGDTNGNGKEWNIVGEYLYSEGTFSLSGMSCASCTSNVEGHLKKVVGVGAVSVALLAEKAVVQYDANVISAQELEEKITALGYPAEHIETESPRKPHLEWPLGDGNGGGGRGGEGRTFSLEVRGMSGASCITKVEEAVLSLAGVVSCSVNLATGFVRVVLAPPLSQPPNDEHSSLEGIAGLELELGLGSTPAVAGPRDVLEAVQALGYWAEVVEKEGGVNRMELAQARELQDWRRSFLISLVFTLLLMTLHAEEGSPESRGDGALCGRKVGLGDVVSWVLVSVVQVVVGRRFYTKAFKAAVHGSYGMDMLVVMSTTVSYMYSSMALVLACVVKSFRPHLFLDSPAMLLTFITFGKYLEAMAKGKTCQSLATLLRSRPRRALLVVEEKGTPEAEGSLGHDHDDGKRRNREWEEEEEEEVVMMTMAGVDDREEEGNWKGREGWERGGGEEMGGCDNSGRAGQGCVWKEERDIDVALVQPGDVLKVLPGSQFPTDGLVKSGRTYVDESMITGESKEVLKKKGDAVIGGTINKHGMVLMLATTVGADTALAQLCRLVEEAQMSKAKIQMHADRVAGIFVPSVLCASFATFLGWFGATEVGLVPEEWIDTERSSPFLFALLFGVSVMVIACPCALGLATPTAVMVGTGIGASNGVLIKGGAALEATHSVTTVVFDKTGTLTTGEPSVTDVVPLPMQSASDGFIGEDWGDGEVSLIDFQGSSGYAVRDGRGDGGLSREEVLLLAAGCEAGSEHPVGRAIVKETVEAGLTPEQVTDFVSEPGRGVSCTHRLGKVCVGTRQWAADNGCVQQSSGVGPGAVVEDAMRGLELQGKTAALVTLNGMAVGVVAVGDQPRQEAQQALLALKGMGYKVWLVSGDNCRTVAALGEELGVPAERTMAEVLPADKAEKVRELQRGGESVAMVGDGLNDAPALATADVGIAIGAGTQVAMEAADMILVRSDLTDVIVALHLSQKVFHRIQLNFVWAMLYNTCGIPVAAGVLYPLLQMRIPPAFAALSMALSSISVVLSSLSLKLYKRPEIDYRGRLKQHGIWDMLRPLLGRPRVGRSHVRYASTDEGVPFGRVSNYSETSSSSGSGDVFLSKMKSSILRPWSYLSLLRHDSTVFDGGEDECGSFGVVGEVGDGVELSRSIV